MSVLPFGRRSWRLGRRGPVTIDLPAVQLDVPHEAPTLSEHVDSAGNVLSVLFGPATPTYLYPETFSAGWV